MVLLSHLSFSLQAREYNQRYLSTFLGISNVADANTQPGRTKERVLEVHRVFASVEIKMGINLRKRIREKLELRHIAHSTILTIIAFASARIYN
jgi:hypothetical protein